MLFGSLSFKVASRWDTDYSVARHQTVAQQGRNAAKHRSGRAFDANILANKLELPFHPRINRDWQQNVC